MPDFSNPYYPYKKVIAANTLRGSEQIPYKLLMYLLDLPDALGYVPIDDNNRARVRLIKYLWEDGPDPLSIALPTPEQKLSLLFDPSAPVVNTDEEKRLHPKGYRMMWQRIRGQSQTEAEILLKCFLSRIKEDTKFITTIGVMFEIWCNVNLETNTRTSAYQRTYDIEQCLHEALDGVNIDGIGTFSFARDDHNDNYSEASWTESENVGRYVHFSVDWSEGGGGTIAGYGCER